MQNFDFHLSNCLKQNSKVARFFKIKTRGTVSTFQNCSLKSCPALRSVKSNIIIIVHFPKICHVTWHMGHVPMKFLLSKNTHKCKDCVLSHFRCPICIAPKGSFLALNTVSSLNINYICNALNCTFSGNILIISILYI